MFCPFHDNKNTPSAKMYRDADGWHVWCFSEHRMYGSADVYSLLMAKNLHIVFEDIWKPMSDEQHKYFIESFGKDVEVGGDIPALPILKNFKKGKMSYVDLVSGISKLY